MQWADTDNVVEKSDPLMPVRLHGRSPIDPRAVTSIRWLALAGQTVALLLVYYVLRFDVPIISALNIVLVGVIVNLWQVWRLRNPNQVKLNEVVLASHLAGSGRVMWPSGGAEEGPSASLLCVI